MIDSMFPLSIFMLLAGFLAGSIGAFLVFGAKTIILMTILMWLGMFRILPLVQAIERIIHDLFPAEVEQLENNIRESFRVEGTVDKEPAIYLFHPHGLFSMSHTLHIMTSLTNWPVMNKFIRRNYINMHFLPKSIVSNCHYISNNFLYN